MKPFHFGHGNYALVTPGVRFRVASYDNSRGVRAADVGRTGRVLGFARLRVRVRFDTARWPGDDVERSVTPDCLMEIDADGRRVPCAPNCSRVHPHVEAVA